MERKFDRYIVKKKNEEVYLHTNISKYGNKLNCTNGVENAQLFETEASAKDALAKYIKQTKTAGYDMFEIHEIEVTYGTLRLIEGLPNQDYIYLGWLGISTAEAEELVNSPEDLAANIQEYLKNNYRKTPRSFDISAVVVTDSWKDVNGKVHNCYKCCMENIEWEE